MIKNKFFLYVIISFISIQYANANEYHVGMAEYLISKYPIVSKQIEIQYALLSKEKYSNQLFPKSKKGLPYKQYIVEKAFISNDVSVKKTVKRVDKAAKVTMTPSNKTAKQFCVLPHDPNTLASLVTFNKLDDAQISKLEMAFDKYSSLYASIFDLMDEKGQFKKHRGIFYLSDGTNNCLSKSSKAKDVFPLIIQGRNPKLKGEITSPRISESSDIIELDLSLTQLKYLQKAYEFMSTYNNYYIISTRGGNALPNLINEAITDKLNSGEFDNLLDKNETKQIPDQSDELNLDNLKL